MDYSTILARRWPGKQWVMSDTQNFSTLVWLEEGETPPTLADVEAFRTEVSQEVENERMLQVRSAQFRRKWPYEKLIVALATGELNMINQLRNDAQRVMT